MPVTIEKPNPDTLVLDFRGDIGVEDVERAAKAVEAAIADGPPIGLVVDFDDVDDVSLEAVVRDARFELSHLGDIDRLARVALVDADGWLAVLSQAAGKLFPGTELRNFDDDDRAEAIRWAGTRGSKGGNVGATKGQVHELPSPRPDLFAWRIDGDLTVATVEPVLGKMEAMLDRGPFDLLVRIDNLGRVEWGMLRDERYRRLKREGLVKVRRYAVVGAPDWMDAVVKLANPFLQIEMRTFDDDEEATAWAWLDERRAA